MNAERRPARLRVRDFADEFDGDSSAITIRARGRQFRDHRAARLFIDDTGE